LKEQAGVIASLLEHGAHINVVDAKGNNALHRALNQYADVNPIIVSMLLEAGVDVNQKNALGETPLHVLISGPLNSMGQHLSWDATSAKALQLQEALLDIIDTLFAYGADPSIKDNQGKDAEALMQGLETKNYPKSLFRDGIQLIRDHIQTIKSIPALAAAAHPRTGGESPARQYFSDPYLFKTMVDLLRKGEMPPR
jgi:hypothetical protein